MQRLSSYSQWLTFVLSHLLKLTNGSFQQTVSVNLGFYSPQLYLQDILECMLKPTEI